MGFFVSDIIKRWLFGRFGSCYLGYAQPLDGSILLKFLLETRLESRSFELLINFLAFLVQKL